MGSNFFNNSVPKENYTSVSVYNFIHSVNYYGEDYDIHNMFNKNKKQCVGVWRLKQKK